MKDMKMPSISIALLGKPKKGKNGDEEMEKEDVEEESDEYLDAISEDIISAINEGDSKGLSMLLKTFYESC